uniref:p-granule-associated protein DEPS-1 second OB-fold domain-containing protein n=1 Tax=Panagrolaimus davidi TaxID=227884 RepID=A0A914Q480_9BILA
MMRLGSREARFFNRERNVQNGVVVECNFLKADRIALTVVDLARHESVYVLQTCFRARHNADTRSQFYKDERPYEVFENVNFECDENNIVTEKIARNQKKWECFNMGNDVFAVKDVCLFSRHNPPKCYSELAGREVPYDPEIAKLILLPNVPLDCFLQFEFTSSSNIELARPTIQKLEYRVHSVEQVNPDRFGLILKTVNFNSLIIV